MGGDPFHLRCGPLVVAKVLAIDEALAGRPAYYRAWFPAPLGGCDAVQEIYRRLVGETGFEPAAPCTPCNALTNLRRLLDHLLALYQNKRGRWSAGPWGGGY